MSFLQIFAEPMLWPISEFLQRGCRPDGWVQSWQRNIPKKVLANALAGMRPIALQNVHFQWLTTVVLMQILLPSASPPRRESTPSNAHTK